MEPTDPHESAAPKVILGVRFAEAAVWMIELHARQARKGERRLPYISHLLAVAGLVLEDGGSEDEAIAALLHDAVEDQPEHASSRAIEDRFGKRVAEIVNVCTDADRSECLSSSERKRLHLDHLRKLRDQGALRVLLADKLHNARAIVGDLEEDGPHVWDRFNVGRDEQIAYYTELASILSSRAPGPLSRQLERLVGTMASESRPTRCRGSAASDHGA